jgi:hypothetical protein
VGAALRALLGGVAHGGLPRRLPHLDAAGPVQPLSSQPARDDRRDGGPHREDRLALPRRRFRELAARDREDGLRGLVGPQAPRGQHLHGQGSVDVYRRPRDQQLSRVCGREDLLRDRRRQPLCARRAHRPPPLARAGPRAVRPARILLRDADDCVRARLHREHGRHALRVRRVERKASLGTARRHLHLHRSCSVAAPRLRRHLRRVLHGVRRGDRRPALAVRGVVGDPRRAERRQRPRLLRRLSALWPQRLTVRQGGGSWHLRSGRAHGQARVAVGGRRLQSCCG